MSKDWYPITPATETRGSGRIHIITSDFFDYAAAADRLIRQLGWDESDRPEVIAALRDARGHVID